MARDKKAKYHSESRKAYKKRQKKNNKEKARLGKLQIVRFEERVEPVENEINTQEGFLDGLSRDAIYSRDCYSSNHEVTRPARFADRYDDNFIPLDYHQHCNSQSTRSREESHDRDANYGRSIYGSDFRRGDRYDSWNRGDHVYDAQSLRWDECPARRLERDYRQRSTSPHVRSHNRSYLEGKYDNRRNHEHYSMFPSIYGSDFRSGNGYDSWKRGDCARDAKSLSWERDVCPGRRRERSWSLGRHYSPRSRSPHVPSHRGSYREDYYDSRRNHEHSSVVPSIYGSDFRSGNAHDSWKRGDHVRDAQSLSWERDECPGSRRELSCSRGYDYLHRSRSPHVRTHSQSHQEDTYDHRGNREHSSGVPSATVKVMGLSKKTTVEYLHQILARWGPLRNVRVMKERNSSSCRGIAFVDFPSVVNARKMMDAIGYDGLSVDGMMLRFEYRLKRIKSKNKRIHEKKSRERKRQKASERATTDAPALRQQHHQYEEKVLRDEVEEEREAEEKVSEEEEVEESEAEEVVSKEEEVEESEAEDVVSEEVEAEDSEAEEMESEEEEVEESGAEEVVLEEGEEGESEVEEMEDIEEKTEHNEEEGEVGEDMVQEEQELGSDYEMVVDMNKEKEKKVAKKCNMVGFQQRIGRSHGLEKKHIF